MSNYLRISVTYLDPRYHGRQDGGEPEWPPSPLRLLQAIVATSADQIGIDPALDRALAWIEQQPPPTVVAPRHEVGAAYQLSVPNNAMDLVGRAWSRGAYHGSGDANPATHRTMKTVRPIRMVGGETIRYLWPLTADAELDDGAINALTTAARRLVALGWGVDLVFGNADVGEMREEPPLDAETWRPANGTGSVTLRTPIRGSLQALQDRHAAFLTRLGSEGFVPVEPLSRFEVTPYRRAIDPESRPYAVFELRNDDGGFFTYFQKKLIHIAGMVRHVAIETMRLSPPLDAPPDWLNSYVAGHSDDSDSIHRQLSYLPLPSIGHEHVSPAVRRVMLAAPIGDGYWIEHIARRLAGQRLRPTPATKIADPPTLVRIRGDSVTGHYTKPANRWASVTPVILPGHDDHKPAKRTKLILKALARAGIDLPCEFEPSAISYFHKSLTAHGRDRDGKQTGYRRPDHLRRFTAVHLTLKFPDGIKLPGPLVLGAGRHCGFGLMAGIDD